jgi:CheY-like chemotaxis protein
MSSPRWAATPTDNRPLVLVIEDNQADVFLVERAIELRKLSVRVEVISDGEEACSYFAQADASSSTPCPAAVLLDLNLPRKSGQEVLRQIKHTGKCSGVPVVIITSSNSPEDRRETAALGAAGYFRKPTSYQEFLQIGQVLEDLLAGNEV